MIIPYSKKKIDTSLTKKLKKWIGKARILVFKSMLTQNTAILCNFLHLTWIYYKKYIPIIQTEV